MRKQRRLLLSPMRARVGINDSSSNLDDEEIGMDARDEPIENRVNPIAEEEEEEVDQDGSILIRIRSAPSASASSRPISGSSSIQPNLNGESHPDIGEGKWIAEEILDMIFNNAMFQIVKYSDPDAVDNEIDSYHSQHNESARSDANLLGNVAIDR